MLHSLALLLLLHCVFLLSRSRVPVCRSALWRFVSQTKTTNKNAGFTQGSRRTALKQGFGKDFKIPDPKQKATYNSAADAEPGALPQHKPAKHFNENNEGRICVTFEVGTCTCSLMHLTVAFGDTVCRPNRHRSIDGGRPS